MSVRRAPQRPATDLASRPVISFRHPGYTAAVLDIILALPRVDKVASESDKFGVHHATALLACQIIANNAFNGYLSTNRESPMRITTAADGVLTDDEYFFIVPGNIAYAVVPSFQDWKFPHVEFRNQLWWPDVATGLDDLVRRCAVTQCTYVLEKAHLVPQDQRTWYLRNAMQKYSHNGLQDIDNKRNLLNLRIDLRRTLDNKDWVVAPKPTGSNPPFAYAVHVLGSDAPAAEFHTTWHNSEVLNLQDNSKAYLFARFAWAVIQGVKPFILAGVSRNVARVVVDNQGTPTWKTGPESAKVLDEQYGGGGSKGATPRNKRSRITSAADSEAEEDDECTPFDPLELDTCLERIKRQREEE
ncbi:hypothetical protein GE09DRAFT_1071503 [Coniochaeta sp. 2T2.1]|nr:hypothetical protein GE09DRAFT_1071503 [Coniochaeta sp. 2T2.1]